MEATLTGQKDLPYRPMRGVTRPCSPAGRWWWTVPQTTRAVPCRVVCDDASSVVATGTVTAGGRILAPAGFAGTRKTIKVQAEPQQVRGTLTVIPLRWTATGLVSDLFPHGAKVEIAALDPGRAQIVLVGAPAAPLGALGARAGPSRTGSGRRVTIRRRLREACAAVTCQPSA